MAGLLLCLGLVFLLPQEVKAEETDPEADTQIEYTVTKVPGKINMLAGETRYVSTSIPYTATFESSDPKIAAVANSGLVEARKKGTVKITQTDGTTKKVYTVKVNDTVDLIIFAAAIPVLHQSRIREQLMNLISPPIPKNVLR